MDKDCIFCKIVNKELPSTVRYEDENFLAFDNIDKKSPEHILLIPKKHYASLEEVELDNDEFHTKLITTARKVAHEAQISKNYKMLMNIGKQVQAIYHLHVHIMGGWNKNKKTSEIDKESQEFINS